MERAAALAYASTDSHAAVSEWIDYAQSMRRRVTEHRVRIIVSPRTIIAGAKDITAGDTVAQCLGEGVLAGAEHAIIEKLAPEYAAEILAGV